jgi:hypothetical protein
LEEEDSEEPVLAELLELPFEELPSEDPLAAVVACLLVEDVPLVAVEPVPAAALAVVDGLAAVAFFAAACLLVFVTAATCADWLEADRAGSLPEAS